MSFLLSYAFTSRVISQFRRVSSATLSFINPSALAMHSEIKTVGHQNAFQVRALPALGDNFMYLLVDSKSNQAAAIDPVEPKTVQKAVEELGCELTHVLTTHHHSDHAGGNEQIVQAFPNLQVVGGDSRIPALTKTVKDGDELSIGNLRVRCMHTPCHTSGHICYYVTSTAESDSGDTNVEPAVFTGDTLFVAGCGKFFEGTPQQMYTALVEKLAKLPNDTKVYCGHEYTKTNLKFAAEADPENKAVKQHLAEVEKLRASNQPTVPSTIGDEKQWNVFMRAKDAEEVGKLRQAKDKFKG